MNNLNILSTLSTKTTGAKIEASEWQLFINTLIQAANSSFSCMKTGIIEKLNTTSGAYEILDITPTNGVYALTLGETYRVSGLINGCLSFTGTTGATSTLELNNVIIINTSTTTTGKCIEYSPDDEKKSLKIKILADTESYLFQKDSTAALSTKGCINSCNNIEITGQGYLYIYNAIGHGIKANTITVTGLPKIVVNVAHDGIHADQMVDIENGKFYCETANDFIGTDARATGDEGKLKGIIRIFGGDFYIKKVTEKVFDYKYDYIIADAGTDATYYIPTETAPSTIFLTYHSKIFSPFTKIEGPGVTSSNLGLAPYNVNIETGGVYSDAAFTTPITPVEGVYTISTAKQAVYVKGYVEGKIVFTAALCELHLNNAILVPLSTTDEIISYTLEDKNVQIQVDKNTEASYIYGKITSLNNVRLSPKGNSYLYVTNPSGIAINGSGVEAYNGGGQIYVSQSKQGLVGTEVTIGGELDREYKGNIYILNNDLDIYTRVSSKNIKATVTINSYFGKDNVCITGTISTGKAIRADLKNNTGNVNTSTGIITDSSGQFVYNKLLTPSTIYGGTKYGRKINGVLCNYFD